MTRKLQHALEEQKKKTEPANPQIAGLLGIPLGGQKRIEVSGRNAYVYVRLRSNQNEVIQAYNNKVSPSYGLPVLVERQGNRYAVSGVDTKRYDNNWSSQSAFLPRHGNTHSFDIETGGGGDIVWVYPRQITPVLVMPSGSAGAGGVIVNPYILKNDNGTWRYVGNTGTASFSPYLPTSPTGAIMALVCLEASSGNPILFINSGSVFLNSITGSSELVSYIPQLTNPVGNIPLAAIRLITGTNKISWDNIYDVRQLYHVMSTGSAGGGGAIDTGTLNSLYLRLDVSNDPLIGDLLVSGTVSIVSSTLAEQSVISIHSGTNSPYNIYQITRHATGLPPAGGATYRGYGFYLSDTHPFATYIGGLIYHTTQGGRETFINPYAPSGTVAQFNSEINVGTSGSLLNLRTQSVEKFKVDGNGNVNIPSGSRYNIGGVSVVGGLANLNISPTTDDIILTIGARHFVDTSGLTADRALKFPSGTSGDLISIYMIGEHASYAPKLQGNAGVPIEGVAGGTEWDRLWHTKMALDWVYRDSDGWRLTNDNRNGFWRRILLGANGQPIDFQNIPAIYNTARFKISARSAKAAVPYDILQMTVNGLGGANYESTIYYWYAPAVWGTTDTTGAALTQLSYIPAATAPANSFGGGFLEIEDYANTNKYKRIHWRGGMHVTHAAAGSRIYDHMGEVKTTNAITQVTFSLPAGTNFLAQSEITCHLFR